MGRHANTARDAIILERLKANETLLSIARTYGISKQRVYQVGREHGHRCTKITDTAICPTCGKEFTRNYQQIYHDKTYCCRKCQHQTLRKPKGKWSLYGSIKLICSGCGVVFERTNKQHSVVLANKTGKDEDHNFCTRECFGKHGKEFFYMT